MTKIKVALVHDFLTEWGGAERVLVSLHKLFPQAPVYTAFYLPSHLGRQVSYFKGWDIRTSFLARIPAISRLYSPLRLWSLFAFEQFDFSNYQLVISSSNMYMAKGIITRPETFHISYLHSIPKYLYGYTTARNWRQSLAGKLIAPYFNYQMRIQDYLASQRPDILLANSQETKSRIFKAYRRQASVIYPPVRLPAKFKFNSKQDYLLVVSRLVLAKHIDLVVNLANKFKLKLKIVGQGPEEKRLRSIAGPSVSFLGNVSDEELSRLYKQARVLIFPAEDEDFGIVPVEAQVYGTPVIGHKSGGSLETIKDGQTGVLFSRLDLAGLTQAWHKFNKMNFDQEKLFIWSQQFSEANFHKKLLKLIEANLNKFEL